MPTTPNMSLQLPVVTGTVGPTYATMQNNAMTAVDAHNHAPGSGAPIPVAGINVDQDLSFAGHSPTQVAGVVFQNQTTSSVTPGSVYEAGGDLYFTNAGGAAIQITSSGSLAAAGTGSIQGLVAPASVGYSSISKKFTFQQNTNISADLDAGTITVRADTTSASGVALTSPVLTASYTLTFPNALPTATLPLVMSAGGVLSTMQLTSSQLPAITDGTSAISMGTGWVSGGTKLVKLMGMVTLNMSPQLTSGAGTTVMTLPAGYRPASTVYWAGINNTGGGQCRFQVDTAGVILLSVGSVTTGMYLGSVTFPSA